MNEYTYESNLIYICVCVFLFEIKSRKKKWKEYVNSKAYALLKLSKIINYYLHNLILEKFWNFKKNKNRKKASDWDSEREREKEKDLMLSVWKFNSNICLTKKIWN